MTPVRQTKLYGADGIHNGNCLSACLASLLDLPLWMVPPFEDMFGRDDWAPRRAKWLKRMFGLRFVVTDGHHVEQMPEFYVATGLSPRDVQHAVIYSNGAMVHDPHYSDAGIASVERTYHLEPIGIAQGIQGSPNGPQAQ